MSEIKVKKNKKTKTLVENINEYVNKFLESNKSINEAWNDEENQKEFIKMLKDFQKKEKKKAEKKAKHPDAPKKPKSGYICYCAGMRASTKEEFPDLDNCAIVTKLGEQWKALTVDEKVKWNELAAEDKKKCEIALEEFYEKHPEEKPKKKAAPKAKSAYALFGDAKRPEIKKIDPTMGPKDVMKRIAELWGEAKKADGGKEAEKYKKIADKQKASSKSTEEVEIEVEEEVVVEPKKEKKTAEKKPKVEKTATKGKKKLSEAKA